MKARIVLKDAIPYPYNFDNKEGHRHAYAVENTRPVEFDAQKLFCVWCPNDCQGLTNAEKEGCVASSGFANDLQKVFS